jgi:mannobiose 2-epimerase
MPKSTFLDNFQNELNDELKSILNYWSEIAPDNENGGFYGKIDNENHIVKSAPKGSVLHARILWSFSSAYIHTGDSQYLLMADNAYDYFINSFIDIEYGGVYWTISHKGEPLDTKKQVYAIAFSIYAFSEYYKASNCEQAKKLAIDLYTILVEKSYDKHKTGYFEAFTRDWKEISDLRLSAKDANEKKTMNTHLHVLEAYSNLFKIWKSEDLKLQIKNLIQNFLDHIIDQDSKHLILFFDENWNKKSDIISYGHDIEASWLLLEAAEAIEEEDLITKLKALSLEMAVAACRGLDQDGSMFYEFEPSHNKLIKEKHWWVQAEAMVGFYNSWQISNDKTFLTHCLTNWAFIKNNLLDKNNGEWFWGVLENGIIMEGQDKAGLWKCPYHNSRACMEIIKRIDQKKLEIAFT